MINKARILLRRWRGYFLADTRAAAATEYAILLAVLIIVSIGVIQSIGEKFLNLYTAIADAVGSTL